MTANEKSFRMHRIDACTHPLYEEFRKLYRQSFPVFEQRTPPQQRDAFVHDAYRLLAYTENGLFLGFIACWELATCRYVTGQVLGVDGGPGVSAPAPTEAAGPGGSPEAAGPAA